MNSILRSTVSRRSPAAYGRRRQRLDSACSDEMLSSAALPFFRRAMDGVPCPILIVDGTPAVQGVVYANKAFQQLSGRHDGELHVHDWTSLFMCIPGESDPGVLKEEMHGGEDAHATLCIRQKSGSPVWVSAIASPVRSSGAITHYVLVFHDLSEERRSRQELEHRAYHDPLTGLANRHLLKDRFEQALARAHRHNTSFAVVLLDMDGFKLINDRLGHDMGDELLKCVGARLIDCVREEDTVARIGGDEFVLLLENSPYELTETVIERVAETVRQPVLLNGYSVTPAFCTGVARYPIDGLDLATLLKTADVGLYRSKVRVYSPSAPVAAVACAQVM